MSPVRYEQGFYIPEDDVLHSHPLTEISVLIYWDHIKRFHLKKEIDSF
jgi:hypothetical protein